MKKRVNAQTRTRKFPAYYKTVERQIRFIFLHATARNRATVKMYVDCVYRLTKEKLKGGVR